MWPRAPTQAVSELNPWALSLGILINNYWYGNLKYEETGFVLFVDLLRNELNSHTRFWFVCCWYKQHDERKYDKGDEGDMLEKLKDIYFQFSSTRWKGHNNRIWSQTKDGVIMEPGRIWFAFTNRKIETPHSTCRMPWSEQDQFSKQSLQELWAPTYVILL